jgi:mannose-6-phosphate isomerase-like protein (cupin superfamily)
MTSADSLNGEGMIKDQSRSRVQANLAALAKGDVVYQPWQEYRREFYWRTSAQGGATLRCVEYPPVEAPLVKGRLLMAPPAQGSDRRTAEIDTVYLCAEGEADFTVGSTTFALEPLDLLSIPQGWEYEFVNSGLANTLLCGIYAKSEGTKAAVRSNAPAAPQHMPWTQYRRNFRWTLPWAEQWGYHRGSGPLIISDGLRGHTVRQPPGQSTPWHSPARDMVFMGIQHEVEFKAAGCECPLGPLDFLIIPAGTPYQYTNYGLSETVFFSIGGKLPPGQKATYFVSDPGWPIRGDVEELVVEIDGHGDARVSGKTPVPNR